MEFNPGEKHAYSNHGYALLAALIENVTGSSFELYIEQHILNPLGMKDSGYFLNDLKNKNIALPHVLGEGLKHSVYTDNNDNRWSNSCGGIYSSIKDMCKWAMVSLNSGF